jgi:Fe-S oxidoreductase
VVADDFRADARSQVVAVDPDVLATACPFCMTMFEDAAKETEFLNKDIAELVAEALG